MAEPQPDLDVVNLGMMMVEISPPHLGVSIAESEVLSLHVAGSANIFGNALARLGGKIGLISRIGDDQLGQWLLEQAQAAGMDTSAVGVAPGQLTPLLLASVDHHGNKTFAFYRFPETCDPLATYRAEETPDSFLRRGRVFDLAEGSLRHPDLRREALTLTRRARDLDCVICFSPNYREAAWAGGADEAAPVLREALGLADLVILNESEAMLLSGTQSLAEATAWFAAQGPRLAVITRGNQPTIVIQDGTTTEVPVFDVTVVYDIGAGDVFHAGYLAAWRPGGDPVAAARFAAAVAALKISRPPEASHMPTRAEVGAFLREHGIDPTPFAS
ncbi:MAG: carbohydrate kinase family protein [Thermomicrobiales bacterium]|nr:carbohydrate kinase family protein [Thermomicrobiales bacterium]